ncbi:MAG: hypothetical protein IKX99_06010, partial [Lachnospiraceae bacterium]|nr:hypothetical protein [Lachnospiraceae bacterium]
MRLYIIIVLVLAVPVLLFLNRIEKKKEKEKERENEFKNQYSKVVYALTAYTEGGMSTREALKRVARDEVVGEGELLAELRQLNYELDNGLSTEKALLKFAG